MIQLMSTLAAFLVLSMWGSLSDAASLMKKLQPRASVQRHQRSVPDVSGFLSYDYILFSPEISVSNLVGGRVGGWLVGWVGVGCITGNCSP